MLRVPGDAEIARGLGGQQVANRKIVEAHRGLQRNDPVMLSLTRGGYRGVIPRLSVSADDRAV